MYYNYFIFIFIIILTINFTLFPFAVFENVFAQDSSSLENEDLQTYENSENGIKIKYPSKWIMIEPDATIDIDNYKQTNIVTFSSPPENDPTFMVIVGDPPAPIGTLEDYTNAAIYEHEMALPDFKLIESGNVNLAGHPGYSFTYTASDQNGEFTGRQISTIKDDTFYLLVSTVSNYLYPLAWPTIQKMIDSFEIIN